MQSQIRDGLLDVAGYDQFGIDYELGIGDWVEKIKASPATTAACRNVKP